MLNRRVREMKILNDKREFTWYKKELDFRRKYEHKHEHTPDKYPCKVTSRLDNVSDYSSSYGAIDIYYHYFIYQEEKICTECGHVELVWPSKQVEALCEE